MALKTKGEKKAFRTGCIVGYRKAKPKKNNTKKRRSRQTHRGSL